MGCNRQRQGRHVHIVLPGICPRQKGQGRPPGCGTMGPAGVRCPSAYSPSFWDLLRPVPPTASLRRSKGRAGDAGQLLAAARMRHRLFLVFAENGICGRVRSKTVVPRRRVAASCIFDEWQFKAGESSSLTGRFQRDSASNVPQHPAAVWCFAPVWCRSQPPTRYSLRNVLDQVGRPRGSSSAHVLWNRPAS
jgi:hypothetical protein